MHVNGAGPEVALTPSEVVSVCSGEQQAFTCITNVTSLLWNITVPNHLAVTRLITTDSNVIIPIVVSTRSFNVARNSSTGTLPLASTLQMSNITSDLDGTKVSCTVSQEQMGTNGRVFSRQVTIIDIIGAKENGNFIVTLTKACSLYIAIIISICMKISLLSFFLHSADAHTIIMHYHSLPSSSKQQRDF